MEDFSSSLSAPQRELFDQVKSLHVVIAERAEVAIRERLPAKVISMTQLAEQWQSRYADDLSTAEESSASATTTATTTTTTAEETDAAQHTKKRRLDDGSAAADEAADASAAAFKAAPFIEKAISTIKRELKDLVSIANQIKIWVQLNIPRIEDGNNFGVGIQEEVVNELGRAEDSGFAIMDSISKYFAMRGKLCSKVLKYPQLSDYERAIAELDMKQLESLRLCVVDIRNNYAVLHDTITKNIDKLRKPRSSNTASMY